MTSFFVKQYFSLRWKRWLKIMPVIFIFAILLKYIVPLDFLPANKTLVFSDYIFASLSYPIYILLVIPLLYCYLIYDIVTMDYEDGHITFILSRIGNRATYFISKVILIIITSCIYFFINLFILMVVGLAFKLPLHGEYFSSMLKNSIDLGLNIYNAFLIQYGICFIGLIVIGISVLVISLLFNNGIYSIIFIIICIIQGHQSFFVNNKNLKWSLIGQLALSKHYPFSNWLINENYLISYTPYYSIKFYIEVGLIVFFIGMFRVNRMNFNKKM